MSPLRWWHWLFEWPSRARRSKADARQASQQPAQDTDERQTRIAANAPVLPVAQAWDALAHWQAQCDQRKQLVDEHAPGVPDALVLVQLLDSGPEELIRQLPSSAREALAMCDDPGLPRSRLVKQLARDPSLTESVLRTANSSAFSGGREPVLGMEAALDRIGMANARAVLTASCTTNLLSLPGGRYNAMAAELWSHMIRTGPIAQDLAPALAANPDEALTLGLLHDVGKLVVFDRISTLRAMRRRSIELPEAFVHALLSMAHEPLGALAAQRWELGPRAVAAIGNHHRRVPALRHEPLSELLYLADTVDQAMSRDDTPHWTKVWADGALSASRPRTEAILNRWATVPA